MSALRELGVLETAELTEPGKAFLQYVGPIFLILLLLLTNRYLHCIRLANFAWRQFLLSSDCTRVPRAAVSNLDIPAPITHSAL